MKCSILKTIERSCDAERLMEKDPVYNKQYYIINTYYIYFTLDIFPFPTSVNISHIERSTLNTPTRLCACSSGQLNF